MGAPDGDDSFCFRAPAPGTGHVSGSWGYFEVDLETGEIRTAVYFDPPDTPPRDADGIPTGYRDIARFDPAYLRGSNDILDTVFFTDRGERVRFGKDPHAL